MQLDLQSVANVLFRTFAWVFFAAKMFEIGLPRLRMSRSFLQDLSRAVSRFARGPVAGNHRQHFFDPTGSNTIDYNHPRSDRQRVIEKVLTVISCNWAPGEARNSSVWVDFGRYPTHSETRKTNFQRFRGKSSCERSERYLVLFRRPANPTAYSEHIGMDIRMACSPMAGPLYSSLVVTPNATWILWLMIWHDDTTYYMTRTIQISRTRCFVDDSERMALISTINTYLATLFNKCLDLK